MNSMPPADLGFIHRFVPASRPGLPPLLLLHGTGGDEDDLIPLAQRIASGAALLSPRGKVSENGMARFFRRVDEGVFDIDDLNARTDDLADFARKASTAYRLKPLVALGYSNGANIAWSLLLRHRGLLAGAVLMRAMLPFRPPSLPDLTGTPVLLVSGTDDPLILLDQGETLARRLTEAGAKVEHRILPTGHGLTPEDLTLASQWLKRLAGPRAKA
jgi:phospholipase/carboxylesterase